MTSTAQSEKLDPTALLAAAVDETGLDNFGDDDFREGFKQYVAALTDEAALTPTGVAAQRAFIHKNLVNRLRFEADRRLHPQIEAEPVDDPIFMVGLPRTGTTKLMRMFSADPGVQELLLWRSMNPAPVPAVPPGGPDPRIALAREQEQLMKQMFPDFWAHHAMAVEEPEEDILLHDYCFQAPGLAIRTGTFGTYLPWLQGHDPELRACHRYTRDLLRYLQWQHGGRRGPWILKNVVSFAYLPTIFEVYPQATVVQCHRDVEVTFASSLKLFELARCAFTTNPDFDLVEHGRAYLQYYRDLAARNVAQREALVDKPIVDAYYDDICRDPYTVIRTVHERRGTTFSAEAEQSVRRWDAENPQHRYGRVRYSLEEYGLDAHDVAEAFAPYIERFPIPSKD
jgi:Sulfotransferase family